MEAEQQHPIGFRCMQPHAATFLRLTSRGGVSLAVTDHRRLSPIPSDRDFSVNAGSLGTGESGLQIFIVKGKSRLFSSKVFDRTFGKHGLMSTLTISG